jgi:hypothetical protein
VAADGGRHRRQPERAEDIPGRGHQALPDVLIGVAQTRRGELHEHLAGARRVEIDVLDRPRCTVFVHYRGAGSHQPSGVSLRGPLFEGRFLVGASVVRLASRPRVETPGTEDTAL